MGQFIQKVALVNLAMALLFFFHTSEAVSTGCSDVCDFYEWGKDAECQGRNLEQIPQECKNAKTLQMQDNQVRTLARGTFSNFTCLKYLYLERNNMTLERGAFEGCTMLRQLHLNENNLPTLTTEVMEGLSEVQSMFIDKAGVSEILTGAFQSLEQLVFLSLKDNQLTTPPCYAFLAESSLTQLYLTSNNINDVPEDCFILYPSLTKLYLTNNPLFDLKALSFRGLGNLVHLDLQYTNLTRVPTGIFPYVNNVQTLHLAFNNIRYLNNRDFVSLSRLRNLYLQHNQLISIHEHSFQYLSALQVLDLSHNMIRSIGNGALDNFEYLLDLKLHHNLLNSTKNITFSKIPSNAALHLAHNPFHCDCSIFPFQYWLELVSVQTSEIERPASFLARCSTPQILHDRLVVKLDEYDICPSHVDVGLPEEESKTTLMDTVPWMTEGNSADPLYAAREESPKSLSEVQMIAIISGCIVFFILLIGGFVLLFMKRQANRRPVHHYERDEKYKPRLRDAADLGGIHITANPMTHPAPPAPELPPRPDNYPAEPRGMSTSSAKQLLNGSRHISVDMAEPQCSGEYVSPNAAVHHPKRPALSPQSSTELSQGICQESEDAVFYAEVRADDDDEENQDLEESPADWVRKKFSMSSTEGLQVSPPVSEILQPAPPGGSAYVLWRNPTAKR